jgi:type I site-specific restriction endonuclease
MSDGPVNWEEVLRALSRQAEERRDWSEQERRLQEERLRPYRELRPHWEHAWDAAYLWPEEQRRRGRKPDLEGFAEWAGLWVELGEVLNGFDRIQRERVRHQEQVREIASGLEEKRNIPAVNAQMELILSLQTDEYWQDITLPMLENVCKKLRGLVKFLDREGGRDKVYTDFTDQMGEAAEVSGLITSDAGLKNYQTRWSASSASTLTTSRFSA